MQSKRPNVCGGEKEKKGPGSTNAKQRKATQSKATQRSGLELAFSLEFNAIHHTEQAKITHITSHRQTPHRRGSVGTLS